MTTERDRLAALLKEAGLSGWQRGVGHIVPLELADRLIAKGVTVPASVPADPPQSVSTTADSPALDVERPFEVRDSHFGRYVDTGLDAMVVTDGLGFYTVMLGHQLYLDKPWPTANAPRTVEDAIRAGEISVRALGKQPWRRVALAAEAARSPQKPAGEAG